MWREQRLWRSVGMRFHAAHDHAEIYITLAFIAARRTIAYIAHQASQMGLQKFACAALKSKS
jgi:hypothetical protein